jgi:hypothetical protein
MLKMKKLVTVIFSSLLLLIATAGMAQESKGSWNVGADLYNRYIWRGTDFGNSPVVQPTVEYSVGGFAIGAWGSYSLSANTGGTEADLYMSYAFDSGLSFTFTNYYFPVEPGSTGNYFDFSNKYHTYEIGASQALGDFSLSGYYYLNQNNDLYFEAGYSFKKVDLFVGAGNESYTTDTNFNVVNIGISTSKEIPITEKFSLPVTGSVIVNPDKEQIFFVVGISL